MQRRIIIPAVVFITGACVLVLEVLATRVLAPYFGSTIYTVSSVIGVVLGALSVGYYAGGRIADARPSLRIFYGLITLSGISVFGIEALLLFVMPHIGYKLPLIVGPLIASVTLFFVPSVLLGMLSPFAITLQKREFPKLGIGTLSGEIFFWSTIGSIVGSLSAGFILIPQWGTHTILIGVGVLLCALGVAGVVASRPPRSQMVGMIVLLVALVTIPPVLWASALAAADRYVYLDDGVYERLAIYDGEYKGKPTRFLLQDRSNSSAMFLGSDELAFDYTKYYTLARSVVPDMRHALVLGAGAYSIPRAILSDYPEATIDVVDIEPELENLSKRFFNLADDATIKTHTMDARRFLQNPPYQYDLVFSDIY
ncbi:MAG: fused MFS/spermidine synthase, partial [Patescibacteria group bacterium]